jgi:phospholipase C
MPDAGSSLRTGERAMSWFDQKELPFYYALAKQFAIGDHYFCSLLGPTWPNRMYLWAGTSFGRTDNFFANIDAYPFPQNDAVILDELDKRHVDWKLYTAGGPPGVATVVGVQLPNRWGRNVVFTMEEFYRDAKDGKLPPVVFLDANFLKTGDPAGEDEHPPSNPQLGQKFVHDILKALFASPQWKKLAFFLTYDEHGGLYNHLPPPKACVPDDKPPVDEANRPVPGAFDRYGMRVPFVVVSPYAKKGFVSHGVYDHASVLRFIQAKHRVPALTARDANAAIPVDMFDFQSPPNLVPPEIPEPPIDQAELDYCKRTFRR